MTIIQELLKEIETNNSLTDQIRILCDEIYKEQIKEQHYKEQEPTGPNTFLCLQVPGKTKNQIGFLTLEREAEDRYVAVFQTMNKIDLKKIGEIPKLTRQKVYEINQKEPKKILTEYAKHYKFLRGE
jgi:hypothetical protein